MPESDVQPERKQAVIRWLLLAALPILLHLFAVPPNEPVYNGDANRHVMTSVFFRDLLVDRPLDDVKRYATEYYEQYPALGLMIWPPLFHGVTGLIMTVFGTSAMVPRAIVFVCFLCSIWCLYRLCRRRISAEQSEIVLVIYSLMPMIFEFSRYIMLEMPTLALCLLSIERFDLWLQQSRTRNLYIAAIAAALAALTRFDAAVLLPVLLLMPLLEMRWKQLLTWHVPIAAVFAIIIIGPTYVVIWRELGDLHLRQAAESVSGVNADLLGTGRIGFYPVCIAFQVGWVTTGLFAIGLLAAFTREHRKTAAVFAAILIGTYITFTPLAEVRARHAIYWLPAIAYFASIGVGLAASSISGLTGCNIPRAKLIAVSIAILGTGLTTSNLHPHRVTGYATAADVVLANTKTGESILVDAWWDGNLTYHIRHLDDTRSRHIVRANKVLYHFLNVPTVDFQQYVESDTEILQAIADTEVTCIAFEDPQPFGDILISKRIHALVKSMPQQFPLLKSVPVEVKFPGAEPFDLKIFAVNTNQLHAYLNPATQRTADPTLVESLPR